VILFSVFLVLFVAPVFTAKVTIEGRNLLVDGKRTIVQSVGYAPVPVGIDPTTTVPYGDYFTANFANIYRRDLVKIRDLGANAVRIWGWDITQDHSDFLNAAINATAPHPIYVIPGFFISPSLYPNLADPSTQQKVIADLTTFITNIKQHPAVLFYLIGSDLNADWNYGNLKPELFSFLNVLAATVKKLEPENPHPVSTALNDQDSIGTILQYDTTVTNFDFWAVNVYRGCDFGPLFRQFQSISSRPIFISEFGIDEYDDVNLRVDSQAQARCIVDLWGDIEENETISFGGSVTEFLDEWWKSKLGIADSRHPNCPNYNPSIHTNCGSPNVNFPDKYANQAYFGIVDGSTLKEKLAYYQLQELWREINGTRHRS